MEGHAEGDDKSLLYGGDVVGGASDEGGGAELIDFINAEAENVTEESFA